MASPMGSGRGTPSPSGIRPPSSDRSARRSEDPEHVWNEAATSCVLLRHLPAHEQKSMRTSCRTVKLRPKMVVYKQKSFSDVFYVVQSGRYVATLDADGTNEERIVREYNKGDTFGSHELYFSQPRTLHRARWCPRGPSWGMYTNSRIRSPLGSERRGKCASSSSW